MKPKPPMKLDFSAKASADGAQYEIRMYGDVGGGWFGDGITDQMVSDALKRCPAGAKVILRVNSYGGEAWHGLAIKNVLATHEAYVEAHIDGIAASAMATVVMGANKIVMHEGSGMMIHEASGRTLGTVSDHKESIAALETLNDGMAESYARKMGCTKAEARAMMAASTYLTPAAALEKKLCDVADPMVVKGASTRMTSAVAKLFGYSGVPEWMLKEGDDEPALEAGVDDDEDIPPQATVVPYEGHPTKDSGGWDAGAAKARIKKWATKADGTMDWAKYRKGFAWYDGAKADTEGAYKLPHQDIVNGSMVTVRAGVIAAGNAVQGARGGVGIPDSELPGVRSHLEKHYAQFKMTAPWKKALLEDPNDDPEADPPTESTMNKTLLAQMLGISAAATDEQFEAAIQERCTSLATIRAAHDTALADAKAAKASLATVQAVIVQVEAAVGATGEGMIGALEGHMARSKKLGEAEASLAAQALAADEQKRAALEKQGTDEKKLTPALIAHYKPKPVADLEAFLKIAPAIVPGALTLPATGAGGDPAGAPMTHNGKTWAQMAGNEKHDLKFSQPEIYAALLADHQKRTTGKR